MRHFLKIEAGTKPANKLQAAIADRLQDWDRLIIDSDAELARQKEGILLSISNLHAEHPGCAPVPAYWQQEWGGGWPFNENTWTKLSLGQCGVASIIIYHAKN